jgi:hypothetical protein
MDDVLLDIVLRRLGESALAEPATELLLAALESEESLAALTCGRSRSAVSAASAVPRR